LVVYDDRPLLGYLEVDRNDRDDRGDQDGCRGLAPCVAHPGAALACGALRVGAARRVRSGVGVGWVRGAHRRFSVQLEIPSAIAERRKAETAMITACAAAMPTSVYWSAKAQADMC